MVLKLLIFGVIALIPILGWIYFFQTQHAEKKSYVVLTFLAGMLSVVPIKLYEKYWDIAILYLENLNIFEKFAKLTHIPSLDTFLAYILTSVIVAFGLYVFVALMMFVLEYASGDDTIQSYEKKMAKLSESPFLFLSVGILFGVVAYYLNMRLDRAVWFFVMVGILEEFVKHLVTRFSDEFKIHSVADAITFSIIVALGFSFVENILYFLNIASNPGATVGYLATYVVLRSLISVTAHICFSAIMGYYYGIAHFASEIYRSESESKKHPMTKLIHQIIHVKEDIVFREEKMIEGLFLAVTTHAIFNSMLEFGYMNVVIIMLATLFFLVLHLLHRYEVYERSGLLHFREPSEKSESLPPVNRPAHV